MDSKMGEMAEIVQKHEFSEGVQREQRDQEREQAMREVEIVQRQVQAKEKEIA
jgi:hypothetical protein